MSYSWITVRAFYYYPARHIEQHRLEWTDIPAICEMAAISFKPSDLCTAKVNSNHSSPPQQQISNAGVEQTKGCQTCVAEASNYASLHVCRVCKSADHLMLHCAKRKMPIALQH